MERIERQATTRWKLSQDELAWRSTMPLEKSTDHDPIRFDRETLGCRAPLGLPTWFFRRRLDRDSHFDRVVRGINQVLLRTKISLGRLHRSVAQQQLNLLKLTATGTAQFGAGAAVMPHAA
jgi:hypothetical protein